MVQPQPTRSIAELPSALRDFDLLRARIGGRRPAVFLDYDGTLTPIAARPDLAVLAPETRGVVGALAARLPVAVISGRDRADVESLVGLSDLVYAGSHGFDIRAPGRRPLDHQVGADFTPALDRAEALLHRRLDRVAGALIERKRFTIAAHYRQVAEDRADSVAAAVAEAVAAVPGLVAKPGKQVFELQPAIDWHKGRAVEWLLAALGLDGADTVPLFFGDDVTDEDAFVALAARGVGIIVAPPDQRHSAASFRLDDPDQVRRCLARLEAAARSGDFRQTA